MTRREAKQNAKQSLKGKWGYVIIVSLVLMVVIGALSGTGIGLLLLASAIAIGEFVFFYNISKGQDANYKDLIVGVQDGLVNRIILSVMKQVYIFLWSLLFVIPGIVKSYSYALAELV